MAMVASAIARSTASLRGRPRGAGTGGAATVSLMAPIVPAPAPFMESPSIRDGREADLVEFGVEGVGDLADLGGGVRLGGAGRQPDECYERPGEGEGRGDQDRVAHGVDESMGRVVH